MSVMENQKFHANRGTMALMENVFLVILMSMEYIQLIKKCLFAKNVLKDINVMGKIDRNVHKDFMDKMANV